MSKEIKLKPSYLGKKLREDRLRAFGLWPVPGREIEPLSRLLNRTHEGAIMAEYGPNALINYYTKPVREDGHAGD